MRGSQGAWRRCAGSQQSAMWLRLLQPRRRRPRRLVEPGRGAEPCRPPLCHDRLLRARELHPLRRREQDLRHPIADYFWTTQHRLTRASTSSLFTLSCLIICRGETSHHRRHVSQSVVLFGSLSIPICIPFLRDPNGISGVVPLHYCLLNLF